MVKENQPQTSSKGKGVEERRLVKIAIAQLQTAALYHVEVLFFN